MLDLLKGLRARQGLSGRSFVDVTASRLIGTTPDREEPQNDAFEYSQRSERAAPFTREANFSFR